MSRKADVQRPDDPQARWRRHRILVRVGQVIMALGGLVIIVHWIAHLQPPPGPSGLEDLLVGYPTGGLLVIAGAVLAGRRQP
ncbi:hypothetical protein BKD30_07280 [Tersicoccus phoenicis]|uniref:Uncharacterized protein n=1 Tax=Tersicoccus phoenicis TaxID=554083 RepID=A0A1R1LBD8_9MICC|nr:hypothetical protein [Tersicoccus phoenicis]OMH24806.1 hypothetical protein BKD30_07280 [Tersicoccus phoenicis]